MTKSKDKLIHYCWFGPKEISRKTKEYIESWKYFLPDYEIVLWNEENFPVNSFRYTKEAYSLNSYAHVSDLARFWILYNFGGIYLDTDVELIGDISKIIEAGPFMGNEKDSLSVAPGLIIYCEKGNATIKDLLDIYISSSMYDINGEIDLYNTVVTKTTNYFISKGAVNNGQYQFVNGMHIYPKDYFCPMDYETGKLETTENTVSIHWYEASWIPESDRKIRKIELKIHEMLPNIVAKPLSFIYRKGYRLFELIKEKNHGS